MVLGGDFTGVNGSINRIARLASNGSLDSGFNPGTGVNNGTVKAIAADSNERIVIGGSFSTVNGQSRHGIARLTQTGALDTGFAWPESSYLNVNAMAIQVDDNILIGDELSDGGPETALIRLLPNGQRDSSFHAMVGVGGSGNGVSAIAYDSVDGDHVIYVAGKFSTVSVNGQPVTRHHIALFDQQGNFDASFNADPGPKNGDSDGSVNCMVLQQNTGRPIVAGSFYSFKNITVDNLARLQINGALDTSFSATDRGWSFSTPQVNYSSANPGSLELHVSDGQHWSSAAATEYKFSDPSVYVNGYAWLTPSLMSLCGSGPGNNLQIFQGSSVPSAHFYCSQDHEDSLRGNVGLWDILEPSRQSLPTQLQTGSQRLTITSEPTDPSPTPSKDGQVDKLSLILAVAKLPPGSAAPIPNAPVAPPADSGPIGRADRLSVHRHLGATLLDVLSNDTTFNGLLTITAVSTPLRGGKTQILYASSTISYEPNALGTESTDEFTYSIIDANGNAATVTVTIDLIDTPSTGTFACGGAPVLGQLSSASAQSLTRGGGQYANYYSFTAVAAQVVSLTLTPITQTLKCHVYIRDPRGWLVAGGSHPQTTLNFTPESTGTYVLEV